ncbi:MAG: HU family DNA-binding protein [Methylovulum sp.]|jgi:DNA-binding protein HU-beta|nr:HU family DNA-binding protein [Methylovulum sp.]MCF7998392.1 HU family DNA-binding protein [Methylovulum sp.]
MNKSELIDAMADTAGLTKDQAVAALNAFVKVVENTLSNSELDIKEQNVTLVGFGTFSVKERAERKGRNPQTGEEILIKSARIPSFKAGKSLKDAVN